jgi:hypothetical protein
MAETFGIGSNTCPTGYTGTVINRFTSDYTYEKTEKEYLGNPPVVVDRRTTGEKKTRGFNGTLGFTSKPDEEAVIALLGTQVTMVAVSDDLSPVTETITGTLMKISHSGEKDGWWEATVQIGPDTILPS